MVKISFNTSEIYPFIKTGGLADVCSSLPKALSSLGHEILIMCPMYKQIKLKNFETELIIDDLKIPIFQKSISVYQSKLKNTDIKVLLINNDEYYNRDEIYDDYEDNLARFSFFSLSILEVLKFLNWEPDIIHANDWQTAMLPAYLKILYKNDAFFKNTRSLFTIHNLGYQGIFNKSQFKSLGIDSKYFDRKYIEYYDKINILKSGLVFTDAINTVSETYAKEIQTPEFGFGLDGVLAERKNVLFGILNGIDYDIWNPATDKLISTNYDSNTIKLKYENKAQLQKSSNLPVVDVPVIGIISRMVNQKGFDLLIEILDVLVEFNLQMVILGAGNKEYEDFFKKASEIYPNKIRVEIGYNDKLSHEIEAGADMFLMPSYYEPCGLNQMISLKYGTVPIVRKTGGLADTVKDVFRFQDGNGFVFSKYDALELLKTILKAIKLYQNKDEWIKIIKNGMRQDFSFHISARKYEQLYYNLLK